MPTANERLQSETIRRQVDVQRFIRGQIDLFLAMIRESDLEINRLVRERLPVSLRSREFALLIADMRAIRDRALEGFKRQFADTLTEFAELESSAEQSLLIAAIPIDHTLKTPAPPSRGNILNNPIQVSEKASSTVNLLFRDIVRADRERIEGAIRLGLQNGEGTDDIIRRLRGTRRGGFSDGVYQSTRRQAEALVRTIVNDVSNHARDEVFQANSDVIRGKRWLSTLDLRTSGICRYRDGRIAVVGSNTLPPGALPLLPPTARPPAHINCRSVLVALISLTDIIGERPFVNGTRLDFRRMARERVGRERWRRLSRDERNRRVRIERERWHDANVGTVPAATTYHEWLSTRPATVQDEILGPTRGRLYRQGRISLDQMHDRFGNPLTLAELASRYPSAGVE